MTIDLTGMLKANENMDRLMTHLELLSVAIGQLNPASSTSPTSADVAGHDPGDQRRGRPSFTINDTVIPGKTADHTRKTCKSDGDEEDVTLVEGDR